MQGLLLRMVAWLFADSGTTPAAARALETANRQYTAAFLAKQVAEEAARSADSMPRCRRGVWALRFERRVLKLAGDARGIGGRRGLVQLGGCRERPCARRPESGFLQGRHVGL